MRWRLNAVFKSKTSPPNAPAPCSAGTVARCSTKRFMSFHGGFSVYPRSTLRPILSAPASRLAMRLSVLRWRGLPAVGRRKAQKGPEAIRHGGERVTRRDSSRPPSVPDRASGRLIHARGKRP